MRLPKLNIMPWWLKLAVPVGGVILLVVILMNWWGDVKTKITHEHEDYVAAVWELNLCDSLHNVSEQNLISAQRKVLQKDSLIEAFKFREAQHQANNYELKKQLGVYRRDNRVCYKYTKVGTFLNKEWQWIEVPCIDVNSKNKDPIIE
jgi:hypothetical protein